MRKELRSDGKVFEDGFSKMIPAVSNCGVCLGSPTALLATVEVG